MFKTTVNCGILEVILNHHNISAQPLEKHTVFRTTVNCGILEVILNHHNISAQPLENHTVFKYSIQVLPSYNNFRAIDNVISTITGLIRAV
ncbi:MAG: hypothetical protein ACJAXJ_004218, partial [Colwellia sp.]